MFIELDFVKQLTTTKLIKEDKYITKNQIKESYNNLIDSAFLFGKSRPEYEKLQDKIKLKYTYLCLIKILEDYSDDYEADKDDLRDKANQVYESSVSYKEFLRQKNKGKCTYINPYQNLLLGNSSTNIEIKRGYERQLSVLIKLLDIELNKMEIDPKAIIECYATYLLQKESFDILNDPLKKRIIDEEILINFNPNQEGLFSKVGINKISYIPDYDSDTYKMTNKFNDIIYFQKIGTLGYEKFKSSNTHNIYKDEITLQNYRICKEYYSLNNNDGEKNIIKEEFNIFTDLNIAQLTSDSEFTSIHADILFSDLNLRQAQLYNGGYIGEIIKNVNGKYDVYHYQDKLCACIEYQHQKESFNNI